VIEELATVTALEGAHAWVQTQRQSVCESCSAQKGCGTSAIGKVVGKQYTQVRVLNSHRAVVGDLVKVVLPEDMLLKSSFAVYMFPLALMLLGAGIADHYAVGKAFSEWFAVIGAVFGLLLGGAWLKFYARRMSQNTRFQPVVVEIVQSGQQQSHAIYTP
jgi:sigma-E factor negative regulatory protein RseC